MVPAVCSVYLFKSLCLLKSAQPAEPSAPMWRLGVGARAGEVISYYFIYCCGSRAGGGCPGELGCEATGLGTSWTAGASPAGCGSPRWQWPGLATPLV